MEELLKQLELLIAKIKEFLSTQKPEPPKPPPNNLLNVMGLAIQRHEGWILNPPSRSVRNKNPFNLRYVGQPTAIGKDDNNFCIFDSYEAGFAAGKNMILSAAKGHSSIYHPTDNLYDFFKKYAPAQDSNNPKRYAEVVAQAMHVNPSTFHLKNLL